MALHEDKKKKIDPTEGLNDSQKEIVLNTEGLMVVDAGPGTGKTHTIVQRYANILLTHDVDPRDVLLMTFTNNAAREMDERIKSKLADYGMIKESKLVMTKTFDAFCLSVVMDSPELVSSFFKTEQTLTRAARMTENETMNNDYFCRFLDDFLDTHPGEYGEYGIIASQNPVDLMKLISKLMSYGIVPLESGWFGRDYKRTLRGDTDLLEETLLGMNKLGRKNGRSPLAEAVDSLTDDFGKPDTSAKVLDPGAVSDAANEDRRGLYDFVHDVFYAYIVKSIRDNRLTFGLVATFAYVILFDNDSVRDRYSFEYVMIDEFQDTNANQLMIAMMILDKPNLCVVGDWKQGIYGFRFVSIENIIDFEGRLKSLRGFLNDDRTRVRFHIGEVKKLPMKVNYRSSQEIIDLAFRSLYAPGVKDEDVGRDALDRNVTKLVMNPENPVTETAIRYVQSKSNDDEPSDVVRAIWDYVTPGRYTVHTKQGDRGARFGDIAVICPKNDTCRAVMAECEKAGIPAFLQGDVMVMSTREGKLALAWLRYVNNEADQKGYVPILADMKYSMDEISAIQRREMPMPPCVVNLGNKLRNKRRRITELLTLMYDFYGLNNDITQSIITTLSTAHSNSLMTISDLITLIDEDIRNDTTYPVDNSLFGAAVTIMTMHKSKGLEYPIVISPYLDRNKIPRTKKGDGVFEFSDLLGLRCKQTVGELDGYSKITKSWKTAVALKAEKTDYDEDRRLMFVTLSRAKQYMTLISGPTPSKFLEHIWTGDSGTIPDAEPLETENEASRSIRPDVSGYVRRSRRVGVHQIMELGQTDGSAADGTADEAPGKGMEYGSNIHKLAYYMCRGFRVDEDEFPELPRIRAILDGLEGAEKLPEVDCGLPVDDSGTVLRGTIDLLAVWPDRIEVHDYKTDVSRDFEQEYRLQLSVYAHAAELVYRRPVTCVIDYVSRDETERFEPLPMSLIRERVTSHMPQ